MKHSSSAIEMNNRVLHSRHASPLVSLAAGHEDRGETLTLGQFCRQPLETLRARLLRQGIQCEINAADTQSVSFADDAPSRILARLIADACDAMPSGGQLDITAVVVGDGVEIEVADSRSDELASQAFDHELVNLLDVNRDRGIRFVEVGCPQGGLARTVIATAAAMRTAEVATSIPMLRRAA